MIRVLGIDPSLSATGIALPTGDRFCTVRPKAGADDIGGRLHEIYCAVAAIAQALRRRNLVDVAVIETVSLHGKGGPLVLTRLGQLSGVMLLAMFEAAIPVVEVNSSSLKKYATGNGSAQKQDIEKRAKEFGVRPANDNEADAYFLKKIGHDFYNMTPAESLAMLEPHQLDLQERLTWPRL